ncbi:MAG: cytidine deaminase [Saprospiraceae bacterium]
MSTLNLSIPYTHYAQADIPTDISALCLSAKQATSLAYAPYSKFFVGAAARLESGKIIQGANMENAAYPQCLCAEAVLLGSLHSQYPNQLIEAIGIAVSSERALKGVAAPCGSCRQQLFEAENRQKSPIKLYLLDEGGDVYSFADMKSLLPFGFVL